MLNVKYFNIFGPPPPSSIPSKFMYFSRIIFQAAVQDVRVWGANSWAIDNDDGNG